MVPIAVAKKESTHNIAAAAAEQQRLALDDYMHKKRPFNMRYMRSITA